MSSKNTEQLAAEAEEKAQSMRLVQLAKDLDTTLNFLTSRKYGYTMKAGEQLLYFPISQIESSLKNLNGKALTLAKFQQLIWLVPNHYTYKLANNAGGGEV